MIEIFDYMNKRAIDYTEYGMVGSATGNYRHIEIPVGVFDRLTNEEKTHLITTGFKKEVNKWVLTLL